MLKFKSQLTFAFFAAVHHLSRPLRKQKFTSTGSRGHGCYWWLEDFDPFCVFLCFKVRYLWSWLWLTAANNVIVKVAFMNEYVRALLRFSKALEFWSLKANWLLRFSLPSIILADLLGNRNLLQRVLKVMVCDWGISSRFVCCCVSRFVSCGRNYAWRQRIMQLWKWVLKFGRVRVFLKRAVKDALEGLHQVLCLRILKIIHLRQNLSCKAFIALSSRSIINSMNNVKNQRFETFASVICHPWY